MCIRLMQGGDEEEEFDVEADNALISRLEAEIMAQSGVELDQLINPSKVVNLERENAKLTKKLEGHRAWPISRGCRLSSESREWSRIATWLVSCCPAAPFPLHARSMPAPAPLPKQPASMPRAARTGS